MKNNPDDRRDNVERIQKNIDCTIENIELANEMIDETPDEKMKKTLAEKNRRRQASLDSLREEIKDETQYQKEQ